jgi:glycosyltransferase involved in cell wall biosynthesis
MTNAKNSKVILFVHHDAASYGSDQSLRRLLQAVRNGGYVPVTVLPYHGPLVDALKAEGFEVHLGPVGKIERAAITTWRVIFFPFELIKSIRFFSRAVGSRDVCLVYSNSIGAIGGGNWAFFKRVPHIWHVREIIRRPRVAGVWLPRIANYLAAKLVCNSNATRGWVLENSPSAEDKSFTVWNGIEDLRDPIPRSEIKGFRSSLGLTDDTVLVTLAGRINGWKGQDLLVEACGKLREKFPKMHVLLVGDPAVGQEHHLTALQTKIDSLHLQQQVTLYGFSTEMDLIWAASDIAVVPSIEPEPFGRVAIEAMRAGLPVIAADHGGLSEILVHELTGLLFAPSSVADLVVALDRLLESADLRRKLGDGGLARQKSHFSQYSHDQAIVRLINDAISIA